MEAVIQIQPGDRFGRLTVILRSHSNKHRSSCYLCRCDCGTVKTVNRNELRSGKTQSCGCLARERMSEACKGEKNAHYKHGGRYTKLYNVWRGMHDRCSRLNHISYKYYGGKGVTVFNGWTDFDSFREWALNNGYQEGLSIDRVNSSKSYNPENCEWVTKSENIARCNRQRHKEA